jgi:hypothetical protein
VFNQDNKEHIQRNVLQISVTNGLKHIQISDTKPYVLVTKQKTKFKQDLKKNHEYGFFFIMDCLETF